MIRHAFLGLAVSTCLVACLGKTTSLGGPDDQSGASSTPPDAVAVGLIAPARAPRNNTTGDAGGSSSPLGVCHGYAWAPVPSSALCEYVLPAPNVNPGLDPMRWDPANVTIFTLVEATSKRNVGQYVGSAESCGSWDGWYYVDTAADADADADAGQTRTLFAICPKSCASVTNDAALLRLSAATYCE